MVIVKSIEKDLMHVFPSTKNDSNFFIDNLKASGEDNSAKLIAAYFTHIGIVHNICVRRRPDCLSTIDLSVYEHCRKDERLAKLGKNPVLSYSLDFLAIQKTEHSEPSIEGVPTLQVQSLQQPWMPTYMKISRTSIRFSQQTQTLYKTRSRS